MHNTTDLFCYHSSIFYDIQTAEIEEHLRDDKL